MTRGEGMSDCARCEELEDEVRRLKGRLRVAAGPVQVPDEALSNRIATARLACIKWGYLPEVLDKGRALCGTAEAYLAKLLALRTGPEMSERYRNSQHANNNATGFGDPDDAWEVFMR
jgi:hypothetical protein